MSDKERVFSEIESILEEYFVAGYTQCGEEHAVGTTIGDAKRAYGSWCEEREREISPLVRNFYSCDECNCSWQDVGEHSCNDRCPQCDLENEPYCTEDEGV